MHHDITIEEARTWYKTSQNVFSYVAEVSNAIVHVFTHGDMVINVARFPSGRTQQYAVRRSSLVDDYFFLLQCEEMNFKVVRGTIDS